MLLKTLLPFFILSHLLFWTAQVLKYIGVKLIGSQWFLTHNSICKFVFQFRQAITAEFVERISIHLNSKREANETVRRKQ